ncbi:MAG: beta-N-acetylhexosaminidase, partial [Deltaproteobacteria bacterium]|nr:beta-N-acetylhexosaminidase [Deltaproteobacteria bacterium]
MTNTAQLKQKIGQRLIVGFHGETVPPELRRLDEEWGLGGFILFKRNIKELEQLFSLNESLLSLGRGVMPFIGVDQEGGRVARLTEPFTPFPDMACVGQHGTVSMAYEVGAILGRELSVAGFNLNFAPVLDVNTHAQNPIIGPRAISSDPEVVATLGRSLIQGLHDNAVVACGKHFPGHGDTREDSHVTLPVCDRTEEQLLGVEMLPYRRLLDDSARLDMVMLSHVLYPALDPKLPASLSQRVIQDFLRAEVGFRGATVSDDLEMAAIAERYSMEEVTHLGLEAGLDLFLVCHSLERQVEVLETLMRVAESGALPKASWDVPVQRIVQVKRDHFRQSRKVNRAHARELI